MKCMRKAHDDNCSRNVYHLHVHETDVNKRNKLKRQVSEVEARILVLRLSVSSVV